jgi:hypothetical protein
MSNKDKIPRPELITDASGARRYKGAISEVSGGALDKSQQQAVLLALKAGSKFPSSLQVEGVSAFNPHSQQSLHLFLQRMEVAGTTEFDRKLGWKLTDKGMDQLGKPEAKKDEDEKEED